MYSVVKRDGQIVDFDVTKISSAITKAFEALHKNYHPSIINMLALQVTADFDPKIKDDASVWKASRTVWKKSCPIPAMPMWQKPISCTGSSGNRSGT